jgi:hypothetical protein
MSWLCIAEWAWNSLTSSLLAVIRNVLALAWKAVVAFTLTLQTMSKPFGVSSTMEVIEPRAICVRSKIDSSKDWTDSLTFRVARRHWQFSCRFLEVIEPRAICVRSKIDSSKDWTDSLTFRVARRHWQFSCRFWHSGWRRNGLSWQAPWHCLLEPDRTGFAGQCTDSCICCTVGRAWNFTSPESSTRDRWLSLR